MVNGRITCSRCEQVFDASDEVCNEEQSRDCPHNIASSEKRDTTIMTASELDDRDR